MWNFVEVFFLFFSFLFIDFFSDVIDCLLDDCDVMVLCCYVMLCYVMLWSCMLWCGVVLYGVVGGRMRHRPYMLLGWEVAAAARAQVTGINVGRIPPSGALPQQWQKEHRIRADVDTLMFPDGCAAIPVSMTATEELYYCVRSFFLFGVLFLLPLSVGVLLLTVPWKVACSLLVLFLAAVYLFPSERYSEFWVCVYVCICVCVRVY